MISQRAAGQCGEPMASVWKPRTRMSDWERFPRSMGQSQTAQLPHCSKYGVPRQTDRVSTDSWAPTLHSLAASLRKFRWNDKKQRGAKPDPFPVQVPAASEQRRSGASRGWSRCFSASCGCSLAMVSSVVVATRWNCRAATLSWMCSKSRICEEKETRISTPS